MKAKSAFPVRCAPTPPFSACLDPQDDGPRLPMSAHGGNISSTMAVIRWMSVNMLKS
jgi:hypothetical protein